MKTRINPEDIQTAGELVEFLKTTDLFHNDCKADAIEYFSRFDSGELIDNIENIPESWVLCFCSAIRGKTIDRFRHRIKSSYYAFEWAKDFGLKELGFMWDKIKDTEYVDLCMYIR